MATTMVTNELLCFTMFHYGKATKNEILMTIHGFYTGEEVLKAKDVIFDIVNNLPMKVDGIPRLKARKESTNKRRLDCEDILNLIEFADKKQLELPTFCAMDLNRLPRLSPCDVDAVRTAETVEDLKHHVHSLSNEIVEIKQLLKHGLEGALAQRQSYKSTDADFPPLLATSSSLPPSSAVVSGVGNSISNGTHGIWAELAENLGTDDFLWLLIKSIQSRTRNHLVQQQGELKVVEHRKGPSSHHLRAIVAGTCLLVGYSRIPRLLTLNSF